MIGKLRALVASFFILGGGALFGGGSGGGGSSFTPYSPTGLGGADTNWQTLLNAEIANAFGPGSYTARAINESGGTPDYLNWITNGPLGTAAVGLGQEAGNLEWPLGQQAGQAALAMNQQAGTNYGYEGALANAGNQLYQTGFDPQRALYNQGLQQTQDQSRASTTARGIGMSGNAAGIENEAVRNYNMNWENQQLARQAQALQGLVGAYNQAGQQGQAAGANLAGAQEIGQTGIKDVGLAGTMPEDASMRQAMQQFQNQASVLNAGNQLLGPFGAIMSQIIPYLNFGAGAQANAFNAGQSNISNLFSAGSALNNAAGNPLGGVFSGGLGALFGNPFASAGGFGVGGGASTGFGAGDLFAGGLGDLLALGG